jgi:hypothetical protein
VVSVEHRVLLDPVQQAVFNPDGRLRRDELPDLIAVLYGLDAVLRLHLAQEEEDFSSSTRPRVVSPGRPETIARPFAGRLGQEVDHPVPGGCTWHAASPRAATMMAKWNKVEVCRPGDDYAVVGGEPSC